MSTTITTTMTETEETGKTRPINQPTRNTSPRPKTAPESPHPYNAETAEKKDLIQLRKNKSAFRTMLSSSFSLDSRLNDEKAEELETRLKTLVSAFSARAKQTKVEIKRPPTPSTEDSDSDASSVPDQQTVFNQMQVLAPDSSNLSRKTSVSTKNCCVRCWHRIRSICRVLTCNYILDPQGRTYVAWLAIVSIFFLYNAWSIPLRSIFPYQSDENVQIWFQLDCIADVVYLLDILLFKSHYKFIQEGFWVKRPRDTWIEYIHSRLFKVDLGALFPLDIFCAYYYANIPWLRIPRLLKICTFWELFQRLDNVLASPHTARITRTIIYMLYMIHLNASAYYALSEWEGINSTEWTYDGEGNAYIRCFYFATKTATSIGKNPKPGNETEYMFMTVAWLSGVFIFAVLIGQVRDIVATATKPMTDYQVITGATINYLHRFDVPNNLQDRVKLWLTYTWEQQKTLDERKILAYLPQKMQADLALHVHIETISKVKLFHNCEPAFLRDLVVKLRSIIFLPGDYVCRKGEVGKEMYIVRTGRVNVIGGASGNQILATLGGGSAFGEIALLAIGGMTKRTADVRSAGFSNLFVLSKADLNQAIKDYPLAQAILRRKAKKLIKESMKKEKEEKLKNKVEQANVRLSNAGGLQKLFRGFSVDDDDKVIIKAQFPKPKLLSTVLKAIDPSSMTAKYLKYGSKANSIDLASTDPANQTYPASPFLPASSGHLSSAVSVSYMSDSSDDNYPCLPFEEMSVLDVWRDDSSDDLFFGRRKSSVLKTLAGDMRRRSTMTSTGLDGVEGSIPAVVLHPSTPNESDNMEVGSGRPIDDDANDNVFGMNCDTLTDRISRFQRQLSIRCDDDEEEDDENGNRDEHVLGPVDKE